MPLVFDTITKDQENTDVLPNVLKLLVNITSHEDGIMCEYNLRAIPQILSLYTPQINVSSSLYGIFGEGSGLKSVLSSFWLVEI